MGRERPRHERDPGASGRAVSGDNWRTHQETGGNKHWTDILADVPGIEGLVIAEVQNHEHSTVPHRFKLGAANAEFIAHAPSDVLALLSALDAERERTRAVEAERDALLRVVTRWTEPATYPDACQRGFHQFVEFTDGRRCNCCGKRPFEPIWLPATPDGGETDGAR